MERYELVEGTSSKFWEVELAGNDVTVRFGRIGTQGQTKTKTFGDAAAAQKEWEKLVKEKTGKGYGLVASAGTRAAVPVATPAPRPAAKPLNPSAATPGPGADSLTQVPPSPMAVAPALDATSGPVEWPAGGFQWTADLERQLPVYRGVHAPARSDPFVLAQGLTRPRGDDLRWFPVDLLNALAQGAGRQWQPWKPDDHLKVTRERMVTADRDTWLEWLAQRWCAEIGDTSSWYPERKANCRLPWLMDACVALQGLPFAMELALRSWDALQAVSNPRQNDHAFLEPIRAQIAAADDATYASAFDAASALWDTQPQRQLALAYLFPHHAEWCAACVAAQAPSDEPLLLETALPPADWVRYVKAQQYVYWTLLVPGLLLQMRLHGADALPAFAYALQRAESREVRRDVAKLIARLHAPEMVALLVAHIEDVEVRATADAVCERFPAAVLAQAIARAVATGNRTLEGWTVRAALRHPQALASALAAVAPHERERFQATLAQLHTEEAAEDALPPVLRHPPWKAAAKPRPLPVLAVEPLPRPERMAWDAATMQRGANFELPHYLRNMPQGERFPRYLALLPSGTQRLLKGEPLQPGDVKQERYSGADPSMVLASPQAAQLLLWNSYPPASWSRWGETEEAVRAILVKFGLAALPGFLGFLQVFPDQALPLAVGIDAQALVTPVVRAFRQLKKSRVAAERWLRAHAETALSVAVPAAFREGPAAARDDARHAVRWFAAQGWAQQVQEAAAGHGSAMSKAVEALLAQDPLAILPARVPKLPAFFVAAAFRRPQLRAGGALPVASLEHLGTMLALGTLESPYGGLEQVREACTPASLAEFAWDLFEAWTTAGSPSKEAWAFTALGLLGDDETARRLAPKIREWPGESAHARAVAGLDLLAAIGSDVALMHLNGIAGKARFKALQERAKEKIAAVAEARGFTSEELADRLVPDLGLDEDGTVTLDFGPRRFSVGFDESLKPFVRDEQGARLKDLPKPNKADDAAMAEAATERYKQMKKDAKAVASLQLIRLEMGMVARRRWSAADFDLFFLRHPLMRHLAARLVWGVYGAEGRLAACFRVAEDWTLADANDDRYVLPPDASVGICHVLEIDAASLAAFGQLFADYEIQQPFRQLGRETFTLTDEEKKQATLTRFAGKAVATGSVLGLTNRGWVRGEAQDAGWVGWFSKPLPGDLQADVDLEPGTVVGDMSYEPKQTLPTLTLRRRGTYDNEGLLPFGALDPILASEVLRDLDLLAPLKE